MAIIFRVVRVIADLTTNPTAWSSKKEIITQLIAMNSGDAAPFPCTAPWSGRREEPV